MNEHVVISQSEDIETQVHYATCATEGKIANCGEYSFFTCALCDNKYQRYLNGKGTERHINTLIKKERNG